MGVLSLHDVFLIIIVMEEWSPVPSQSAICKTVKGHTNNVGLRIIIERRFNHAKENLANYRHIGYIFKL